MNIYKIIIYLIGLVPTFQLILIGMILIRRSSRKTSVKLINIYKALSIEIIIFLLSIIAPLTDGGIFIYYIFAVASGIPIIIFQYKYYKSLTPKNKQENMTKFHLIWVTLIILGLIYWIIYYITNILPIVIYSSF